MSSQFFKEQLSCSLTASDRLAGNSCLEGISSSLPSQFSPCWQLKFWTIFFALKPSTSPKLLNFPEQLYFSHQYPSRKCARSSQLRREHGMLEPRGESRQVHPQKFPSCCQNRRIRGAVESRNSGRYLAGPAERWIGRSGWFLFLLTFTLYFRHFKIHLCRLFFLSFFTAFFPSIYWGNWQSFLCFEQVFEALRSWVLHKPVEREAVFADLLGFVRLPLLTPQYLSDRVAVDEYVRKSLRCRSSITCVLEKIFEEFDYSILPLESWFEWARIGISV